MKWVEFLQSYTFVLKHRSWKSNRVVDALSRRQSFLTEMQVEVVGFNEFKELDEGDPNFGDAWRDCKSPIAIDRKKWLDYLIQYSMLFRGNTLCIPIS